MKHSKPWRMVGCGMLLLTTLFLTLANQLVLLSELPNWYDQQRFLALLLLATALLFYGIRPLYPSAALSTGLLLGALLLSITSPLPGWALAETAVLMGLVILAAWLSKTLRIIQQQRPNFVLYSMIIYGMLISLPPLTQYLFTLGNRSDFHLSSLFNGFSNHRFFSQVQSVLIPLMALPAIALSEDSRWRRLGNVVACLLWLLAFAAGTRAFYVAIATGAVFAWISCGSTGRAWCRWQCRFALFGWLGYTLLFLGLPEMMGIRIGTDNVRLHTLDGALDSSGRLALWQSALQQILHHPFTGIGPMHLAARPDPASTDPIIATHPHNTVIQLLTEWGLPMGGMLLGILCLAALRFWRQCCRHTVHCNAKEARILLITLFIAAIYSLFDGSIVTPYTQILLTVTIAWAWSLMSARKNLQVAEMTYLSRMPWVLIRLGSLMASFYLAWLALSAYTALTPHVMQYRDTYGEQALHPRFWSQGMINLPWDHRYFFTMPD